MRTVRYHFDNLSKAVEAAGLEPARGGRRSGAARWVEREARLRRAGSGSSPGAAALASAIRALAAGRRSGDAQATRTALVDVGVAALAWAETLAGPESGQGQAGRSESRLHAG
jgi:hypothetical protein